jgi:hypothetical protein
MTQKIRIKRSQLDGMSDEELRLLANNLFKLEEANKNKRAEYYLERMTCVQEEMHKSPARFVCVWAGNRCLHGDAKIITKSGLKKIRDIQENDLVLSLEKESNQFRYSRSSAAILKGSDPLVRVVHEAGGFVAHPKHALFSSEGEYRHVCDLEEGDEILWVDESKLGYLLSQLQTMLEPAPILFAPNAPHCSEKSEDSEDDYQAYTYLYDQRPTSYPEVVLGSLELQSDVIKSWRSVSEIEFFERLDNLTGLRSKHNRLGLQNSHV